MLSFERKASLFSERERLDSPTSFPNCADTSVSPLQPSRPRATRADLSKGQREIQNSVLLRGPASTTQERGPGASGVRFDLMNDVVQAVEKLHPVFHCCLVERRKWATPLGKAVAVGTAIAGRPPAQIPAGAA